MVRLVEIFYVEKVDLLIYITKAADGIVTHLYELFISCHQ